jgi:hypothetical protein
MGDDQLLITIRRGTDPDRPPVLITAEPAVVRAVIRALVETLQGAPRREVLRLAREADAQPEGGL